MVRFESSQNFYFSSIQHIVRLNVALLFSTAQRFENCLAKKCSKIYIFVFGDVGPIKISHHTSILTCVSHMKILSILLSNLVIIPSSSSFLKSVVGAPRKFTFTLIDASAAVSVTVHLEKSKAEEELLRNSMPTVLH